jgi:hypothetical protein
VILYIVKHKKSGKINVVKEEEGIFYFFGHDQYCDREHLNEDFTVIKKTKLEKLL